MYSLFKINFNWNVYFLLLIIIRLLVPDISWYIFIAYAISLNQFLLLFNSLGTVIPIRYLAGMLMCLQMLLGPSFAYSGLDKYQYIVYQMKIPQDEYFQYAIPAVVLFILGLHVTAGRLKGEVLDLPAIAKFVDKAGNLSYIFIAVGFIATFAATFFGSELGFVFVLLANFKFIGLFMLLLGSTKIKLIPIILVLGSITLDALSIAMFHDLLTWVLMLGSILAIKYRVKFIFKVIATTVFIISAVVIQQLKTDYRKTTRIEGAPGGAQTFKSIYQTKEEDNSLFDYEKLAESNVRINQGYIITNIMSTVPDIVPYENGAELLKILEAAFLPRILAPNKLNAGDRVIFTKYTRIMLAQGTSMGLSSMGDAYINFGLFGGAICMFFFGLLFSEVLNGFYKASYKYPIVLLFTTLVFYYPIRPDCELQTILGHLVKSTFLIYVVFTIWKDIFRRVLTAKLPKELDKPLVLI